MYLLNKMGRQNKNVNLTRFLDEINIQYSHLIDNFSHSEIVKLFMKSVLQL